MAQRAIGLIASVPAGRAVRIGRLRVDFSPAGHLLDAMSVTLTEGRNTLVFSGDLGRDDDLLMPAPQRLAQADALLVESTYGNRVHAPEDVQARLGAIVRATAERGGSVLLPSFAVGRAQALLLVLQRLRRAGAIPRDLQVIFDSPMAEAATALYLRHRKLLRITPAEARTLVERVTLVQSALQSRQLARSRWPRIIISASGMATGGRVLKHLEAMAPDARNHIVFPGFQVAGTRGARLIAGAPEVKIHGEYVPVRADVSHIEGSPAMPIATASCAGSAPSTPRRARPWSCTANPRRPTRCARIQDQLGWPVRVPEHGSTVEV